MSIKHLIKPYTEKHSIKEVVFTLYFPDLITDFSTWETLNSKIEERGFNKADKINLLKYTINSDNPHNVQSDTTGQLGLIWKNSVNNKLTQLLQVKNIEPQNQFFLSFHDLAYIRWANFKEDYLYVLSDLCSNDLISSLPVSALNLTYVDEFSWIDNSQVQLNKIFKESSKYLSSYFFDSHYPSTEIAAIKSEEGNKSFLTERLAIDVQQTLPHTTVVITHTIASILDTQEKLKEFCSQNLDIYLEKTHSYNKQTLENLLTDEVQNLIELPKPSLKYLL